MKQEEIIRHEHILDAAIKRFSHFGVQKTTLVEIANDLGMSKQAFGYYFHDKNSLLLKVFARLSDEFLSYIEKAFENENAEEALMKLPEIKRSFINKYYLMALADQRRDFLSASSEIKDRLTFIRERLVGLVAEVLTRGIRTGQFRQVDPDSAARVLFNTFYAYEVCFRENNPVPQRKDFENLYLSQREVLKFFIHGLIPNKIT